MSKLNPPFHLHPRTLRNLKNRQKKIRSKRYVNVKDSVLMTKKHNGIHNLI